MSKNNRQKAKFCSVMCVVLLVLFGAAVYLLLGSGAGQRLKESMADNQQ